MSEALPSAFGDYVLLEKIGHGATAEVFLARPRDRALELPSPLVIKRLHAEIAREERFQQRFRHEAEIAVRVDSEHVAHVYDVGAVGASLYFAMEYVEGFSIAALIARAREQKLAMPIAAALELIAQALRGLSALHGLTDRKTKAPLRFAHRDLAPKNIMVGRDGVVRIIDLGLGRSEAQEWRTRAGVVMGSLGYMSPEQVTGKPVDHRTDLYTLGIVLFELVAGRRLIAEEAAVEMMKASLRPELPSVSELRSDAPLELDSILRKALAKRPEDRFPSAPAFEAAIDRTLPDRRGSIAAFLEALDLTAVRKLPPPIDETTVTIPTEDTTTFARVIRRPAVRKTRRRITAAIALLLLGMLLGVVARLAYAVL